MYKVAVLGDKDSVCGFACLGLETVAVYDETQAKNEFRRLVSEGYAVIYITEYFAKILENEISKISDSVTPAVILIPGVSGNTGEGLMNINKSVERAVGSSILD